VKNPQYILSVNYFNDTKYGDIQGISMYELEVWERWCNLDGLKFISNWHSSCMPVRLWKCPQIDMKHQGYRVKCVKGGGTKYLPHMGSVSYIHNSFIITQVTVIFHYKGGNSIICELSHFQFLTSGFPSIYKFAVYEVHL
jgi:hypothetical protein